MSKIGIYITGLGQSFQQETVEKYAARFKNEMNINSDSVFDLKIEKVNYTDDQISTVVSIVNTTNSNEIAYKFYEFKYKELLTEKFNKYNILFKNFFLFLLVIRKFPILVLRLFKSESYRRTGQTFYVFGIFFVISLAILFLLPATYFFVEHIIKSAGDEIVNHGIHVTIPKPVADSGFFTKVVTLVSNFGVLVVPLTTIILLIVPQSSILVTTLATEFACADSYIQYGDQSQLLLGDLDLLMEYIQANEKKSKIHIHSYSFGTILAMDLLFPIGNDPSKNSKDLVELLLTVGTPYEFINAYYPSFYMTRNLEMQDKIKWLNVYSISDALATNFRKDALVGNSEFGIKDSVLRPININYEIAAFQKNGIFNFFTLQHIKAHRLYWFPVSQGQNCMRRVYNQMEKLGVL